MTDIALGLGAQDELPVQGADRGRIGGVALFCSVKNLQSLGIGKLVGYTGAKCKVEFFEGPTAKGRKTYDALTVEIVKRRLGPNTRVYFYEEAFDRWSVGRVLHDDGEEVEVRFPSQNDQRVPHEHLFVRWAKPIQDPVEYLARAITETPMYAEARAQFLANYLSQRGAAAGMSALLSSAIELNPHQVDVVARVLSDPSQRYLLADEVGLGKTIEAGVIIRQAILDDMRGHRIVVLVPAALVSQWRDELLTRFGLSAYIDISLFVHSQEMSPELPNLLNGATMLVVDEAHHLAGIGQGDASKLYDSVRMVANKVERLLLLSATPVLRNEDGFLRMLHLLDPAVYSLTDVEGFRAKIASRQRLAETVASLEPENALQLLPMVEEILALLPADSRLQELGNDLKSRLGGVPSEEDEALQDAIRQFRAHLSETYRLHRRILRNRRRRIKWLTVNRSRGEECSFSNPFFERLESALENWRINAAVWIARQGASDSTVPLRTFYWGAVQRIAENPARLAEFGLARIKTVQTGKEVGFNDEIPLLKEIVRLADDRTTYLEKAFEALQEKVQELVDREFKVVVFCSQAVVADEAFAYLSKRQCTLKVVRHEVIPPDEELVDQVVPWLSFLKTAGSNVIICDRRAEEGLNLQGGRKILIHFDLPLDPNRIEHRIGRLDRYGSGTPITSIALVCADSRIQREWYSLLSKGLGVFQRSISSLQYIVEEKLKDLRFTLVTGGVEFLKDLATEFGGQDGLVSREFRQIDDQDALDELAPQAESALERLYEVDEQWKATKASTERWVVDTLMFEQRLANATDRVVAPPDAPFRFRYRVPMGSGSSTLVALSGFLGDFLGALDFEAPGGGSRAPLSHAHSFHRKTAINYRVRPMRYGTEFVEAMKCFCDVDDRGRSYALWRQAHRRYSKGIDRMHFRFSFIVECDLEHARRVLGSHVLQAGKYSQAAMYRRADALFPPMMMDIWVDEDGDEPSGEVFEEFLKGSYAKDGALGQYVDTNLGPERLRYLANSEPERFGNWALRCERMRDRALVNLQGKEILKETTRTALKRKAMVDEIRFAQLETRLQLLRAREVTAEREMFDLEKRLAAALEQGIKEPLVRLDVVGMTYVTDRAFRMNVAPTEAT